MLARGLRLGVNLDRLDVPEIKISNIMTKDLFTVLPENTVEEAVRKMVERDVECLPVISAEQVLMGIITFRDIVTKFVCARVRGWNESLRDYEWKCHNLQSRLFYT